MLVHTCRKPERGTDPWLAIGTPQLPGKLVTGEPISSEAVNFYVLQMFRRTQPFRLTKLIASLLTVVGASKPGGTPAPKMPQVVLTLCSQTAKMVNHVARVDLRILQEMLASYW